MRKIVPISLALLLFLSLSSVARAQGKSASTVDHADAGGAQKHYSLPATPDTVQWGWFDVNEKPKLTVCSGAGST
jgi:hypothetical protein